MRYSSFICILFKDTFSNLDYVAFYDRMANELERIWKEVVVA
jgi:hypothetical protein